MVKPGVTVALCTWKVIEKQGIWWLISCGNCVSKTSHIDHFYKLKPHVLSGWCHHLWALGDFTITGLWGVVIIMGLSVLSPSWGSQGCHNHGAIGWCRHLWALGWSGGSRGALRCCHHRGALWCCRLVTIYGLAGDVTIYWPWADVTTYGLSKLSSSINSWGCHHRQGIKFKLIDFPSLLMVHSTYIQYYFL